VLSPEKTNNRSRIAELPLTCLFRPLAPDPLPPGEGDRHPARSLFAVYTHPQEGAPTRVPETVLLSRVCHLYETLLINFPSWQLGSAADQASVVDWLWWRW